MCFNHESHRRWSEWGEERNTRAFSQFRVPTTKSTSSDPGHCRSFLLPLSSVSRMSRRPFIPPWFLHRKDKRSSLNWVREPQPQAFAFGRIIDWFIGEADISACVLGSHLAKSLGTTCGKITHAVIREHNLSHRTIIREFECILIRGNYHLCKSGNVLAHMQRKAWALPLCGTERGHDTAHVWLVRLQDSVQAYNKVKLLAYRYILCAACLLCGFQTTFLLMKMITSMINHST